MAEITEYRCDGCGRTSSRSDLFAPTGWYRLSGGPREIEKGNGFRSWHACSPLCLGMVSRRHEHEVLMEAMYRNGDDNVDSAIDVAVRHTDEAIEEAIATRPPVKKAAAVKKAPAKKAAPRKRAA